MKTFEEYMEIPEFREIVEHIREDIFACEDVIIDRSDLSREVVYKYFGTAQAMVAAEINEGVVHDEEGVELLSEYMDALSTLGGNR